MWRDQPVQRSGGEKKGLLEELKIGQFVQALKET